MNRLNATMSEAAKVRAADQHEANLYRILVKELGEYAIFFINCEGILASWNVGVEHLLGYSEQEFVGRPFSIIFTQADIEEGSPQQELESARLTGRGADERWHLRRDGTRFFAGGVVTPIRDSEGLLIGYSKILHDITAQKEAERNAALTNQRLSKLARALDLTPCIIRKLDGTITTWTKGAEALYGWSASEAQGRISHELFQTEFLTPLAEINNILLEKGEWQGELKQHTKDQRLLYVTSHRVVHYDEENQPFRIIEVNVDVSDLKRAEEALRQSNLELSNFAHEIAHDLQTPLRNIRTYSQWLARAAQTLLDQPCQEFLGLIGETAARMHEMLEGLLQYAQAKAGREIESQSVHVDSVLQAVLSNLGWLIEETRAEVTWEDLPAISGDPVRLIQLFQNLIGNAIKYRRPNVAPRIRISAQQSGSL